MGYWAVEMTKFRNCLDVEDEGGENILGLLLLEFSLGPATFVVGRGPPGRDAAQAARCTSLELRRDVWVEIKDWESLIQATYR